MYRPYSTAFFPNNPMPSSFQSGNNPPLISSIGVPFYPQPNWNRCSSLIGGPSQPPSLANCGPLQPDSNSQRMGPSMGPNMMANGNNAANGMPVEAENFDQLLKTNIRSILYSVSDQKINIIAQAVKNAGINSFSHLKFVQDQDLRLIIGPIKRRKLLRAWGAQYMDCPVPRVRQLKSNLQRSSAGDLMNEGMNRTSSVHCNPPNAVETNAAAHTSVQAAVHYEKAVIRSDHPSNKLEPESEDWFKSEILKLIDEIPVDNQLPRISRIVWQSGLLLVKCDDLFTSEWLKQAFDGYSLLGMATLTVVNAWDIPTTVKVAFKTLNTITQEPGDLLKQLARFNPLLKSEEWRVVRSVLESHSAVWVFEVDCESVEAIRKAKFTAYTGCDKGMFKILRDTNSEANVETDAVSSTVSASA